MSAKLSESWIFVSHSVRNLAAVRRVRNEIEARGDQPILFFLKQDMDSEVLRTFLRKEIEARQFARRQGRVGARRPLR